MRIVIRAFNKDGYYKDMMIANEQQVVQNDIRCQEPTHSMWSGLIGHGVSIDPKDFPEMVKFEIVIQDR